MLVGSNLSKSFGPTSVLDRLSITVEPGVVTALLGPTGAGKTTLLRALAMIDPPDGGSVEVDEAVFQFPSALPVIAGPWPAIGVVFQDLFLWPHLTNRENILLPLRLNKFSDAVDRLSAMVNELDLVAFLDRYPNEVSRGQRQAVAIARALVLKPRYLLLDEITASLDIGRAARLADTLRLHAEQGAGVMIITHQLAFARASTDRIAFMHRGRILEEGPPSLLDSPGTEALRAFVKLISRVA
jgi:ABC-type polar amino acid transport system ATPase subunit